MGKYEDCGFELHLIKEEFSCRAFTTCGSSHRENNFWKSGWVCLWYPWQKSLHL